MAGALRGSEHQRVVVLGAGFAGLAACQELAGSAESLGLETVVIDRHTYNTFQPLLYQVATAGLNPGDIAYPIRSYLRRHPSVTFRQGEVSGVDLPGRRVLLEGEEPLSYDFLVIATGATTNFFGVTGASEHSHAIYTMEDAIAVRRLLLGGLEHAASFGAKEGDLTVVVVGGGATGVEMAGTLAELRATELATTYRSLDPASSRIILVEQLDRLLGGFSPALSSYALKALSSRDVEVMLNRSVAEVAEDHVLLDGGEELACRLVIWSAGVSSSPFADGLAVEKTRGGRLAVEPDLSLASFGEVFAAGDIAGASEEGRLLAQLAQPAIQEGRHVARQIAATIGGEERKPFCYKDKGVMATIGRRAAVAQLPNGIELRGTPAWFAWLGLHIVFLLGLRNRFAVLLNWAWRYVSWRRGNRVVADI